VPPAKPGSTDRRSQIGLSWRWQSGQRAGALPLQLLRRRGAWQPR
jgi:hypothetical protein